MLKNVKFVNYDADFTYAPRIETCMINLDDIQSIKPEDNYGHRVSEKLVKITFKNGKTILCTGKVEDYDIG